VNEKERIIWLAALLHDIGKFIERIPNPSKPKTSYSETKYTHEPFSAHFVDTCWDISIEDKNLLRTLILKHHAPSTLEEMLITLADRLSSNEREEANKDIPGGRGREDTVLLSTFSTLENNVDSKTLYYPIAPLSYDSDKYYPQENIKGSSEQYDNMWRDFQRELDDSNPLQDATLLALLKKYLWSVPSDCSYGNVPDISLHSHLKSTAAIVICLLRENIPLEDVKGILGAITKHSPKNSINRTDSNLLNRPIASLIKGDISGTQNFLYLLTSHGAARGLRGRSFYLQLLTESIASWVLKKMDLPPTNLLFAGGGHFYLLAPYHQTESLWMDISKQITEKLWSAHQGDLSLISSYVPVKIEDFLEVENGTNAFADKWSDVSRNLEECKQRKWSDMGNQSMMQDLFTPQQRGTTAQDTCQVCHNVTSFEEEEGIRKCKRCKEFEELGRLLRDPSHLIIFNIPDRESQMNSDWRNILQTFGVSIHLIRKEENTPKPPHDAMNATVYTLDSTDFLAKETIQRFQWAKLPTDYDFRLLADATPRISKDTVADYTHLANASKGVKWLGVLRMDVDNLGQIFKNGLKHRATLSRMSTLSEMFRLFFEAWAPQICRKKNRYDSEGKDQVYLLYAGGDDLFVVGAWSALPELAWDIRKKFKEYTGGNNITISAGIAIEHKKFPLYQLANQAKHALDDQAKEYVQPENGKQKDAISFMGSALGWDQFGEIAEWKNNLLGMIIPKNGEKPIPRNLITLLSEIFSTFEINKHNQLKLKRKGEITENLAKELIQYASWQWMLVYKLRKYNRDYPMITQLEKKLRDPQDGLIAHLQILARWTALLTREE